MTKAKRKKTPSRLRYEKSHPTFSFRIYEELRNRIDAIKKAEGVSNTNIVEAAVGLFEVKVRKEQEIREEAYLAGRQKGYVDAKAKYSVVYPCYVCGEPIVVDSKKEKDFIKRKMLEYGWGHSGCPGRKY